MIMQRKKGEQLTIYDDVFPLGLGTNRFPVGASSTEKEIDRCAEIVLRALEMGVNYIDTAEWYAGGYAAEVLRRAFRQTKYPFQISTKALPRLKTADAVRKMAERHLTSMGIDRATDLLVCSVFSFDEFRKVMRPGGVYEGALRLKEEGIVDRITFSTHAPVNDIIRILKENVFAGVMISLSVLNGQIMRPVLDYAYEHGIGVAVMNPLGGGFIPKRKGQFSFLLNEQEDNIVQSALRFVKAHPAVKLVLAGPASVEQIEENIGAFTGENLEPDAHRLERVSKSLTALGHFCTGCRYCEPCPKGIPIPLLMQSRNALMFEPPQTYRRTDPELLRNIHMFRSLQSDWDYLPEIPENPCVQCGECERKCTQRLPIRDLVRDTYARMEYLSYSKKARRDRVDHLLHRKNYRKVAVWPAASPYGDLFIRFYRNEFGEPPFEFVYFNSSPSIYGRVIEGHRIFGPDDLLSVKPDCVLIASYTYKDEIAQSLEKYREQGIDIIKLHTEHDVPWFF